MEILAHVRDVVDLGLVAVLGVDGEAVFEKAAQYLLRLRGSSPVYVALGLDAPVEIHAVQDAFYVGEIKAFGIHVERPLLRLGGLELDQELVEVLPHSGSQRSRRR